MLLPARRSSFPKEAAPGVHIGAVAETGLPARHQERLSLNFSGLRPQTDCVCRQFGSVLSSRRLYLRAMRLV